MNVGVLGLLARCHMTAQPLRTAMTILGVALGVSVFVAIRTANVEVLRSFEVAVSSVAGKATLQVSSGDLGFDERVIVRVRRHPDVVTASPVLSLGAVVERGTDEGQGLTLLALDLLEAAELKSIEIQFQEQDRGLLGGLLLLDGVFVGAALAEEWGLSVGSSLPLVVGTTRRTVVVRGFVRSAPGLSSVWDHVAIMDIAAAQELFGLVGRLDTIDVVTRPGRSVDAIAAELQNSLPSPLVVERPSRRNQQVERMVAAFQLNLASLSAVGLLVGLLLVYNTVSYAVVQRRREIGIYRALGMARRGVMILFMVEGAAMGLVGGILGGWLGMLLSQQLVAVLSRTVSELYVAVPSIEGVFGSDLSGLLIESAILGMAVSIVGAVGPSLEAGRTQPARALAPGQYEEAQAVQAGRLAWVGCGCLGLALLLALPEAVDGLPLFGYASGFCLLLGLSSMAPALLVLIGRVVSSERGRRTRGGGLGTLSRLAADQVARSPGRNAVTISALMVGVAVMVGVGVMIHSFRQTVEHWIDQTIMADLVLAPAGWPVGHEGIGQAHRIPLHVVGRVSSVPGVAAVDSYRTMGMEIGGQPGTVVSRDLAVHAEWSRYLFLAGESRATLLHTIERKGVILSEVLARRVQLDAGDRITLRTPVGPREFPITGVFYDYATDGGKVVMDRSLFRDLWEDDTTTVIPVYLAQGEDGVSVRRRIEESVGSKSRLTIISNAEIREEILEIFDRTFAVTYALELITVMIALLGIANTVVTSVLERQREMATLRAIGASVAQIRRLVLWETSCLGVLGGLMGVTGGVLLSLLLIEVINKQSFGWTIRFMLPGDLLLNAVALAFIAALAAGYLPAVWAGKQAVAEGLRYE